MKRDVNKFLVWKIKSPTPIIGHPIETFFDYCNKIHFLKQAKIFFKKPCGKKLI